MSVSIASILIFARICYTAAALHSQAAHLDPITGSLGVRIGLAFLPDLISTLVYVGVGLTVDGSSEG